MLEAPASRSTPSTATLRICCAFVGRPNRKLASAVGGGDAGFFAANSFAFLSASRIELILLMAARYRACICYGFGLSALRYARSAHLVLALQALIRHNLKW